MFFRRLSLPVSPRLGLQIKIGANTLAPDIAACTIYLGGLPAVRGPGLQFGTPAAVSPAKWCPMFAVWTTQSVTSGVLKRFFEEEGGKVIQLTIR